MNKRFFLPVTICAFLCFCSSLSMELVTEIEYDTFLHNIIDNIHTFLSVKRMFKDKKQIDTTVKSYKKDDHVYISSSEDLMFERSCQSEE